jgi:drug/metabolite transporter (DMT)-like permease
MGPAEAHMSPLVVALWLINVVLDTTGQLAFKAAASHPEAGDGLGRWKHMACRPWLWLGVSSYMIEFLVWIAFLSLVPLSEGLLLGSINIVAIMLGARFLFGEKLTRMRIIGITLVTLGVVIVGATG